MTVCEELVPQKKNALKNPPISSNIRPYSHYALLDRREKGRGEKKERKKEEERKKKEERKKRDEEEEEKRGGEEKALED